MLELNTINSSPSHGAFVFLSFLIYTKSLSVGERFDSQAPVASRENEAKWTEVYTALSTFGADGPSPFTNGSRLFINRREKDHGKWLPGYSSHSGS